MEDSVRILERFFQEIGRRDAPKHEAKPGMIEQMPDIVPLPGEKIVENCHVVSLMDQVLGDVRPDKPGTTRDDVVHDSARLLEGNINLLWYPGNDKHFPEIVRDFRIGAP